MTIGATDPRRSSRDERQRGPQAAAGGQRALGRALDDRAVGQRIGKRHAHLEHVGAGAIERPQDLGRPRQIRIAGRRVVTSPARRSPPQARERVGDPRRHCSTVCTSLSPRPDRFTSNTADAPSSGASFCAYATACADSSAGRIPSSRASVWNASSASASVTCAYSASARARAARRARARPPRSRAPPRSNASARCCRPRPAGRTCACPAARRRCRPQTAPRGGRARSPRRRPRRRSAARRGSSMNASKMPMALLPPPTQATMASGRRPASSRICARASRPMTD